MEVKVDSGQVTGLANLGELVKAFKAGTPLEVTTPAEQLAGCGVKTTFELVEINPEGAQS